MFYFSYDFFFRKFLYVLFYCIFRVIWVASRIRMMSFLKGRKLMVFGLGELFKVIQVREDNGDKYLGRYFFFYYYVMVFLEFQFKVQVFFIFVGFKFQFCFQFCKVIIIFFQFFSFLNVIFCQLFWSFYLQRCSLGVR